LPLNKTLKNIILAFTVVCGLFLIVFSIELILLNRASGDEGADPPFTEDAPEGGGEDGTEVGADGPGPTGGEGADAAAGQGGEEERPVGRPPTPDGVRYEQPVAEDKLLVFYTDRELFELTDFEIQDTLYVFSYKGGGSAALQIDSIFIWAGAEGYESDYLHNDFGAEVSEVHDEDYVGRSQLRGVLVTGANDGLYYEAWIHRFMSFDGGEFALAFVLSYENSAQRNALYDILDTLDIVTD